MLNYSRKIFRHAIMKALKCLSIIYLSCIDHSHRLMNKIKIYKKIDSYILVDFEGILKIIMKIFSMYFEDIHGIVDFL